MNYFKTSKNAASIALVIGALALHLPAQEYILDDFADGDPYDGDPVNWKDGIIYGGYDTGTRSFSDGDWVWTPTDRNMGAYNPDYSYEDVRVHTITSVSAHNRGGLYIMGRDGYWAGILPFAGEHRELAIWDASIFAATGEFDKAFERRVPTTLDPVVNDIHLQLDLLGNSLSLTAWQDGVTKPATPQVLLNSDSFGRGTVGLFHNHWGSFTTAKFGMFEAIPLDPPDFDGSGELDLPDLDRLSLEIAQGLQGRTFDLNEDNEVNVDDLEVWVTDIKQTWIGDTDLDGEVNFADFLALSGSFGGAGSWSQGDFNANGKVEFDDFLALSNHFGKGSNKDIASVPEPRSALPTAIGWLILVLWRIGLNGKTRRNAL